MSNVGSGIFWIVMAILLFLVSKSFGDADLANTFSAIKIFADRFLRPLFWIILIGTFGYVIVKEFEKNKK